MRSIDEWMIWRQSGKKKKHQIKTILGFLSWKMTAQGRIADMPEPADGFNLLSCNHVRVLFAPRSPWCLLITWVFLCLSSSSGWAWPSQWHWRPWCLWAASTLACTRFWWAILSTRTHTHAHIVQYKTLKLNMGFIIHCVWLSCLAEALIQDSKFSRHFMLPSFKWEASALMTHAVIFLSRLLRP